MSQRLGDYEQPTYQQVMSPQSGTPGRKVAPTLPASQPANSQANQAGAISQDLRTQFLPQARRARPFSSANPGVIIAVGAVNQVVCKYTVPERNVGTLRSLRLATLPGTAMANIKWSLVIGQAVLPDWSQQVFIQELVAFPIEMAFEVCSNKTIALVATNIGPSPIVAAGSLLGEVERLSQQDQFGSTSASGVG